MSFLLTSNFDDSFKWRNKKYHVDMSFDNVLLLYELFSDDFMEQVEKVFIAIEMLIVENIPEFNSYEEAFELFNYLIKEFLGIDNDQVKDSNDNKKVIDFNKDAEIIYASFYSDYGIDLFEMKGKLHWKKFTALLNSLNDDTKLKQVIGYRTMDIPDHNSGKEYRDHIIKMKEVYSLDDKSSDDKVNDAMSSFANMLMLNANKGGG